MTLRIVETSSKKIVGRLFVTSLAFLFISFTIFPVDAQEITPPGKPGFLTSTPSENEIRLTWAHPASNGGSMITDWEIELNTASTSESYVLSAPTTGVTVVGLINGQVYEIRVRAKNSAGFGTFSDSIQSTPYSALLSPRNMKSEVDAQKVKLEWEPPSGNGTPLIGYRIEHWYYDTTQSVFIGPTSVIELGVITSYTFTGLTLGEEYKFRIYGISPNGVGNFSELQVVIENSSGTTSTSTSTSTSTTTTVTPPAPCTTIPSQTQTEADDLSNDENQETSATIEIDLRVPPKPFYVC